MKKIALQLLTLVSASAFADPTVIQKNTLTYARTLSSGGSGVVERLAAVGGKVDFTGAGPVYVTLTIGGQSYTALTDSTGQYSYVIWANANQFQTQAWTIPAQTPATDAPTTPTKPVNPNAIARATLKL